MEIESYIYLGTNKTDEAVKFYMKCGFKNIYMQKYPKQKNGNENFIKYHGNGKPDEVAFAILQYHNVKFSLSKVFAAKNKVSNGGCVLMFNNDEDSLKELKNIISLLKINSTDNIHCFDKYISGEHECFYDKFGVA